MQAQHRTLQGVTEMEFSARTEFLRTTGYFFTPGGGVCVRAGPRVNTCIRKNSHLRRARQLNHIAEPMA